MPVAMHTRAKVRLGYRRTVHSQRNTQTQKGHKYMAPQLKVATVCRMEDYKSLIPVPPSTKAY